MLCDFFNVDRASETGKTLDKETLIDRLLDFLGAPDPKLVNKAGAKGSPRKRRESTTTKKKTPKKKSKVVEVEADDDENVEAEEVHEHFRLVKSHKKGDKPTDDALRQWVQAYVVCFDMDSATTKHAIKTASEKFGIDLSRQKDRIKELLAEEM